jgi:hypothetical protein
MVHARQDPPATVLPEPESNLDDLNISKNGCIGNWPPTVLPPSPWVVIDSK